MSTPRRPKLIRDRVPERAAARGDHLPTRVAELAEMPGLLDDKLREEVDEVVDAVGRQGKAAELADVLQVVRDRARTIGVTPDELEQLRLAKLSTHGGFDRRLVWDGTVRSSVSDSDTDESRGGSYVEGWGAKN